MDSTHPLDKLGSNPELTRQFQKKVIEDTALITAVFGTEQGALLIERWTEILINSPTAAPGMDVLTIGMQEGYKNFIRTIINSIKEHRKNI